MSVDQLIVRAGGITFRGQDGPRPGLGWFLSPGVKGLWASGAGMSREKKARQGAHGAIAARGWKEGRIVTLPGYAAAKSMTKRLEMADDLAACLANGFEEPFTADLPDGTSREYVGGLAAEPDWEDLTVTADGIAVAKFQIQFFCSDPRAYGEQRTFTQSTSGLLDVFNRGKFESRPIVSVTATAAMAGYQLKIFDGATQLGNLRMAAIAAGHTVSVDMASGRVTLNGVHTNGLIFSGDRWHIPPGRNLQVMLEKDGAIGTGRLTVVTRDTFI